MKTLFLKCLMFGLLPAIAFYVFLLALPIDQFSFRLWDCYSVRIENPYYPGPFFPNRYEKRLEVGDLAPYTDKSILKNVTWNVDENGFRNGNGINLKDVKVIVSGDSMAVGSATSQDETLSSVLTEQTGLLTYNMGGIDFIKARLFAKKLGMEPKAFVFVQVERNLGHLPAATDAYEQKLMRRTFGPKYLPQIIGTYYYYLKDFFTFNSFQSFKASHGFSEALVRMWTPADRVTLQKNPLRPKMLFYQGDSVLTIDEEKAVDQISESLVQYKERVEKDGMKFIFVGIPNKESIYPDLAGLKRNPELLPKLYPKLKARNVAYVDLYSLYREHYLKDEMYSHHLDDTHWNAQAVVGAATLLKPIIVRDLRKQHDE